jgi:hypothetical protein
MTAVDALEIPVIVTDPPTGKYLKSQLMYLLLMYEAPTAMPDDGKMYNWDEETTSWIEIVMPQ